MPKPAFACKRYPNCPAHFETDMIQVDGGDEEEGFGPMHGSTSRKVKRPCEKRCCEEPSRVSHAVTCIIGGRVVDIGS